MAKKYFSLFVTIVFLFSTLTVTGALSKTANAPSQPSLQPITTKNNAVELNWTAPFNGGFAIQGYRIYRKTNLDGSYKQIGTTTNLFYRDTSISKSSDYYYYITAFNSDGESQASNIRSINIVVAQSSGFLANVMNYLPYLVLLGLLVLIGFGLGWFLINRNGEQLDQNKSKNGTMKKSIFQRPKSKKPTYNPHGLDNALEKIEEILQETQSD